MYHGHRRLSKTLIFFLPNRSASTTEGASGNSQPTENPRRREYANLIKRYETFISCPADHPLTPYELSLCGFYYDNNSRSTRCFWCGVGIEDWEEGDDVRVEHARCFPNCGFLRQLMGQVFVDVVQELNRMLPTNQITLQMIKVKLTNVDQIIGSTYRLENLCHFHYDASRPRNAKACKNQICSFVKTAARKPLYSRYKDRLATITVTDARLIALAGYYYSTVQCLYICYYCGDAKQDLPATANLIIVQHIRSSPYCDYLRSRLSLSDCDVCMALDRNYTNFFSQKDYVKILKVQPDCDDRQDLLDEHTRLNICNLCHRNEVQCQLVCCGIVACESCIVGQRQCQCGSYLNENNLQYIFS